MTQKQCNEAKKIFSDKINYLQNTQECISGKDILVVLTEWNEFRALNPLEISQLMKGNIVIDLRNIFDSKSMFDAKLEYISLVKNRTNSFKKELDISCV